MIFRLPNSTVQKLKYGLPNIDAMSRSSSRAPAYTLSRRQQLSAAAAMVAGALLFHDSFGFLYISWQRHEYSHCVLLPVLSVFLLWQRWTDMRRRHFEVMPAGLLAVLAGMLLYFAGFNAASPAGEAYALVVVIGGSLLTLG